MNEIPSATILSLCRRVETTGALELTARVKQLVGQIFDYAIATSRIDMNPTLSLRGALKPYTAQHHAAITEPSKIGDLMKLIETYPHIVVRFALKFSALTFCRPGEIQHAEWKDIDLEKSEWRVPAEKMKMQRPHIVPLAKQTLALLDELRKITGKYNRLFPSARRDGRPMSENTIRMPCAGWVTATKIR